MASFSFHVVGVAKRVRLERIVRPHLPPQRHRGGSPFNQQIATRTIERARTKRVNPLGSESGGIHKKIVTSPHRYASKTNPPCHTRGKPHHQPNDSPANQALFRISMTCH